MSTTRHPDHLVSAFGSDVVHAAHDLSGHRLHVLACNGRAMSGNAWWGVVEAVTCRACLKALETGKALWVGREDACIRDEEGTCHNQGHEDLPVDHDDVQGAAHARLARSA